MVTRGTAETGSAEEAAVEEERGIETTTTTPSISVSRETSANRPTGGRTGGGFCKFSI